MANTSADAIHNLLEAAKTRCEYCSRGNAPSLTSERAPRWRHAPISGVAELVECTAASIYDEIEKQRNTPTAKSQ